MTVSAELLTKINELVKPANSNLEISSTKLTRGYTFKDLGGLVFFIDDLAKNGYSRGVTSYDRHLAFQTPGEILLLAEVFAEQNGVYQPGNPDEFKTCLTATDQQKPIYLQHIPTSNVWQFSTRRVYTDQDITETVSIESLFPKDLLN